MKNKIMQSSTLRYALFGIAIGILLPILDYIPGGHYESFWFFGFASGSLGIWAIFALCIIAQDVTPKETAKRLFLFLIAMTLSYYLFEATRDIIISYFQYQALDEETKRILETELGEEYYCFSFDWSSCILWIVTSVFCCAYAFITAKFKNKKLLFALFCTPPLLIILGEGINYFTQLVTMQCGFAPTVVDILGFFFCCYLLFFRKKKDLHETE